MQFSHVSADQANALKEIAKRAVSVAVTATKDEKVAIIDAINSHIIAAIDAQDCLFLSILAPQPIAFIIVKAHWNLSDLFVDPEHHGQGVGRMLVERAKACCKINNTGGYLRVNSSVDAVNFYRRLGFVDVLPDKAVPNFVVPLICHL